MEPIFGISPKTVRTFNTRLSQLFSFYLNFMPRAIEKKDVEDLARECGISREEAFANYLAALLQLDAGGEDRLFFRHWLLPSIKELSTAPYRNDAYFKNITIPEKKLGKWQLKTEHLAPMEAFVCDDFRVLPDGRMLPQIGYFKEDYPFPAILENGREWMTLQPNEMVTTMPAIKDAKGRVLTFGMGLGYFTYHAAEKEDVTSVTVVDISGEALDLFATHILPQFPHKEKITLVKKDAFLFAEEDMAGNFDFVFADIWHDAGDGKEPYLKMKEYEKRFPDITFRFWLEETIRCYLNDALWDLEPQ